MAMVFSLVTLIEERLADFAKTVRAAEKKAAAVDKKDSYNDIRVCRIIYELSLLLSIEI